MVDLELGQEVYRNDLGASYKARTPQWWGLEWVQSTKEYISQLKQLLRAKAVTIEQESNIIVL